MHCTLKELYSIARDGKLKEPESMLPVQSNEVVNDEEAGLPTSIIGRERT
jgi:hypothetical protein